MKKKPAFGLTFIACLFFTIAGFSQLTENFSDGNFTSNPAWTGNTADWFVNAAGQLQSQNNVANSSFYLSTPQNLATTAQWEFYLGLSFATSGTNYVDIFLTASAADLNLSSTTGYFVRAGNTDDEISLYRKTTTGIVKIIDGADGSLSGSNHTLKIKVTRNSANLWTLLRDNTGTGNSFLAEGTVTDANFSSSAFFGILVRQSTASFFGKHFLDDIEVKAFVPDLTPPSLVAANPLSATQLEVLFSESVEAGTAEETSRYQADQNLGRPVGAELDPGNSSRVILQFANSFPPATTCSLTVNGVEDLAGNALQNGRIAFIYYVPARFDLVISEIMADPSPVVGLPEAEWIEIKNTSPGPINLRGFRVAKTGSQSAAFPDYLLPPDSAVAISSTAQSALLAAFGRSLGVGSFPSLGNEADLLSLLQPSGALMHAVEYSSAWYQNPLKANGGWSLEMIDPKNPCSGASNWRASVDAKGGTPGRRNSLNAANADQTGPQLLRAFASDPQTIQVFFNEPLDSAKASNTAAYSLSDGLGVPQQAIPQGPLYSQVSLVFGTALQAGKIYTISASNLTDCSGNALQTSHASAPVGLAETPDSLDLVINELLFNPKPLNDDFVEILNRGNRIVNLQELFLANRSSSTGIIGSITALSTKPFLLFPGQLLVATVNAEILQQAYTVPKPELITELSSLPSWPDDKGTVILLNQQGAILDELNYSDKWHFPLLNQTEGVSLERIDANGPTQQADNWTSAAATAGYGTPTGPNSQIRASQQVQGSIQIVPKLFSPDYDGFDDFTQIQYQFTEPGYTANIALYDAAGRPVRQLQRNTTCGLSGSFKWDGLNDKQQLLPAGTYIALVEIFNLKGQRKSFKETVVIARKFR